MSPVLWNFVSNYMNEESSKRVHVHVHVHTHWLTDICTCTDTNAREYAHVTVTVTITVEFLGLRLSDAGNQDTARLYMSYARLTTLRCINRTTSACIPIAGMYKQRTTLYLNYHHWLCVMIRSAGIHTEWLDKYIFVSSSTNTCTCWHVMFVSVGRMHSKILNSLWSAGWLSAPTSSLAASLTKMCM